MENETTTGPTSRITRYKLASFGVFTSSVFLLTVATYPSFFFFNPFAQQDGLRAIILLLCTISWVILAAGPAIIFGALALGHSFGIKFLPLVALAWPVSLILNHLYLAIHDGNPYLTYLVTYPIFIATDILLPLLLIALWLEYRYESHYIYTKVKRVRRY
jgi:hypothetical protein